MKNPSVTEEELFSWTRFDLTPLQRYMPGVVTAVAAFIRLAVAFSGRLFSQRIRSHPRTGLVWAGRLGRLAGRSSLFGPSPEEVEAFLGGLTRTECRAIACEISASALKNWALRTLAADAGLDRVAELIRPEGVQAIQYALNRYRPAIFVFGHNGPILGILAGFSRIIHPVLVLKKSGPVRYRVPEHIQYCFTHESSRGRAMAFKTMLDQLRSGGAVVMALWWDGQTGSDTDAFLGRRMSMTRGFAAAARLTGAAVIPVFTAWRDDGSIDLEVSPPLAVPDPDQVSGGRYEEILTDQARKWLETRLLCFPGQIQIDQLRWILARPRLDNAAGHPGFEAAASQ